jgi:hypothetical protein
MKVRQSLPLTLLACISCGGDSSVSLDSDLNQSDADPNRPDADPNQPDADLTKPDADIANPDAGVIDFPTGSEICTEDDWCWVAPSPQGAYLNAVHAFADDEVWMVGDGGTVLRWDGAAWGRADTNTRKTLYDLWGQGPDNVWIVGSGPTVLHYDGSSWDNVNLPSFPSGVWGLEGVDGSASNNVWFVGYQGTALRWNGSSIQKHTVPTQKRLRAVWSRSSSDTWVVGDEGAIFHWNGSSWQAPSMPASVGTDWFTDVWGSGANDVWARTNHHVYHYDGSSWQESYGGVSGLQGMTGCGPNDIWLANGTGSLKHYDGTSWSSVSKGNTYLSRGSCSPSGTLWFIGGVHIAHGDGTTFTFVDSGPFRKYTDIKGTSSGHLFAVGEWGNVRHWDGSTWHDDAVSGTLSKLAVISSNNVFATGSNGRIFHFDGSQWSEVAGLPTSFYLTYYAIWANGPSDVFAMGRLGNNAHYDGNQWTTASGVGITGSHIYGLWGTGPNNLWGVGENGRIIHKTANGWSSSTEAQRDLLSIWGSGPNDIWAVGELGTVVHYDGNDWSAVSLEPQLYSKLHAVWGRSANDVWIAGQSSIFHYDGTGWTRHSSGSAQELFGLWGDAASTWVAGGAGSIMTRSN